MFYIKHLKSDNLYPIMITDAWDGAVYGTIEDLEKLKSSIDSMLESIKYEQEMEKLKPISVHNNQDWVW
jgi:hypothetical protein